MLGAAQTGYTGTSAIGRRIHCLCNARTWQEASILTNILRHSSHCVYLCVDQYPFWHLSCLIKQAVAYCWFLLVFLEPSYLFRNFVQAWLPIRFELMRTPVHARLHNVS